MIIVCKIFILCIIEWKRGTGGWSVADDGRLASKITSDVDVLHSDGPLLKAGSSVLFKVRLWLHCLCHFP